jgi:hypothetical protein
MITILYSQVGDFTIHISSRLYRDGQLYTITENKKKYISQKGAIRNGRFLLKKARERYKLRRNKIKRRRLR